MFLALIDFSSPRRDDVEEKAEYQEDEIVATDIELMRLRPFSEICKESAKNYKIKDKYAKIKSRGKTLGVKRRIFSDVVETICAVSYYVFVIFYCNIRCFYQHLANNECD